MILVDAEAAAHRALAAGQVQVRTCNVAQKG